jgi:hypothetical protein
MLYHFKETENLFFYWINLLTNPVEHCLFGLAPCTRRIFVFSKEPLPAAIINGVTLYLVPVQSIKSI